MMKRNTLFVLIGVVMSITSASSLAESSANSSLVSTEAAVEHVVWDKTPIAFVVPTGEERMISFPEAVVLSNTNPALTTDKVSILADAGTLYIRAKQAFEPIRVEVKLLNSGQIILLDLSSKVSVDDTPVEVVSQSEGSATPSQRPLLFDGVGTDSHSNKASPSPNLFQHSQPKPAMNMITLIRFAIQQLYAPERLLSQPLAITRSPMYTTKSVTLFYGATINAFPVTSWQGGDLYVTALLVKNTSPKTIVLDPRTIIGNWQAMAFYPSNELQSQGRASDRTTVIVVSNVPFGQALQASREAR